jgi:hypothetical protein
MSMVTEANKIFGIPLKALDIFEYPRFGELRDLLVKRVSDNQAASNKSILTDRSRDRDFHPKERGSAIAVIGMSGRFPGAVNVTQFWQNLCDGIDATASFTLDQLAPEQQALARDNEDYVFARGIIEDYDKFDARFFGITAKEAEATDPQQRLFLEECWAALETAGYHPDDKNSIGVFAGSGHNGYYLRNIFPNYGIEGPLGYLPTQFVNDKDYIATRTSFKLNLQGPAFAGDLVGDDDVAVQGEASGDGCPLLLPAGEFLDELVGLALKAERD